MSGVEDASGIASARPRWRLYPFGMNITKRRKMDYQQFLENKRHLTGSFGFDPVYMPYQLFDFQEYIKESYFKQAIKNLAEAKERFRQDQATLF